MSEAIDQHFQSRHIRKSNITKCSISFPNRTLASVSEGGLCASISSFVELQNFKEHTQSNEIRVVEIDNEPWFVARDVLNVLEIKTPAATALKPLKISEKATSVVSIGRGPRPLLVSESDLYKLVMRSDKQEALDFQDWVTGTVLPSIRKNGGYISGQEKIATGEMTREEFVAKALLVAENIRLEAEERAVRHFT